MKRSILISSGQILWSISVLTMISVMLSMAV